MGSLMSEDWPQWRGPRGNGTWNGPIISKSLPDGGLIRMWKTKVFPGYSGVTVRNGLVYLMDRPSNKVDQGIERVVCLDANSGKERWNYSYTANYGNMGYGKGPRSSITIFNGRAFGFGAIGMAFSLDAMTGEEIWIRNLVTEEKATRPIWGFASSPFVLGSNVLFHAGCKSGGSLIALSQQNGKTKWKVGDDKKAGYAQPLLVNHSGNSQLICWGPNKIMSLQIGGGRPYWEIPYEVQYGVSITKPVFHDGILMVSGYWSGTRAISLGVNLSEAKLLWSEEKNLRGLMSQALCRGGVCYLLDRSNGLTAFKIRTGEIIWRDEHQITSAGRNPHASLVWNQSEGNAFAFNAEGELIFLSLKKSGLVEYWREQVASKTWSHPAFAGDRFYVRDDQSVSCFQLPVE